jgi:hypothetical protein
LTDDDRSIHALSRAIGVTPTGSLHPLVGREQIDLFEQMLAHGQHPDQDPVVLVTTLTQDEIHQVEEHLLSGGTIAGILGRTLDYRPRSELRHTTHVPADGHVDVEA